MDERYRQLRGIYSRLYNNQGLARSAPSTPALMPYWQHIYECTVGLYRVQELIDQGDPAAAQDELEAVVARHNAGVPDAQWDLMQAHAAGAVENAPFRLVEDTLFAPVQLPAAEIDGPGL